MAIRRFEDGFDMDLPFGVEMHYRKNPKKEKHFRKVESGFDLDLPFGYVMHYRKTPKIKNPKKVKLVKAAVAVGLLISMGLTGILMHFNYLPKNQSNNTPDTTEEDTVHEIEPEIEPEYEIDYDRLDFYPQHFKDGKYYLMLEEDDLDYLLDIAIREVQQEYVDCGAGPVFDINDDTYSYVNADHIKYLFEQECSYRMAVVLDPNKSIYDINNLASFTTQKKGVTYRGMGMMDSTTQNYIVGQRRDTFKMSNYSQIELGGEMFDMTWESLDIATFVKNCNPQNEYEYKKAYAQAIMNCAKMAEIYVDANMKNHARKGKHNENYDMIVNYPGIPFEDPIDRLLFFGFLSYNSGAGEILPAMRQNVLFDLDEEGNPKYNTKYGINIINSAGEVGENKLETGLER